MAICPVKDAARCRHRWVRARSMPTGGTPEHSARHPTDGSRRLEMHLRLPQKIRSRSECPQRVGRWATEGHEVLQSPDVRGVATNSNSFASSPYSSRSLSHRPRRPHAGPFGCDATSWECIGTPLAPRWRTRRRPRRSRLWARWLYSSSCGARALGGFSALFRRVYAIRRA
jgi:hypothetical protein